MAPSPVSTQDCIDMLGRLVAYDTTSALSNLALIEDVREQLAALGVEVRLTHNTAGDKANLWATIGPADRGGIVLSGHTDVVPVAGQDWTSDPFTMVERDGLLYGRGTSDMKAFIAIALAYAGEMVTRDLKIPIHFAFSYDEEIGCLGVSGLIQDIAANLPLPRAVIVGEKKGEPLWTNLDDVVVYPEGSVKKTSSRAPVSPTPAGTSPAQSNTPRGNDLELPQRSAN